MIEKYANDLIATLLRKLPWTPSRMSTVFCMCLVFLSANAQEPNTAENQMHDAAATPGAQQNERPLQDLRKKVAAMESICKIGITLDTEKSAIEAAPQLAPVFFESLILGLRLHGHSMDPIAKSAEGKALVDRDSALMPQVEAIIERFYHKKNNPAASKALDDAMRLVESDIRKKKLTLSPEELKQREKKAMGVRVPGNPVMQSGDFVNATNGSGVSPNKRSPHVSVTPPSYTTTAQKQARALWLAVAAANSEREPLEQKLLWPKELGFNNTRTSTAYFQFLMSSSDVDTHPGPQETAKFQGDQIVPDLNPRILGGQGLQTATSAAAFNADANAWIVVCISNNVPPDTPFLISRNVSLGNTLSAASVTERRESALNEKQNVTWVTRNGTVHSSSNLFGKTPFPTIGGVYDVLYP